MITFVVSQFYTEYNHLIFMNCKYIIFGLTLLFALPVIGQNKVKWTSLNIVNDKLNKSDRKFLVYFYYDGCRWCKFMEETTFSQDHIARFVNHNFYAFQINATSSDKIVIADKVYTSEKVGKYDFHQLATELLGGNMSFPAVVFLDEEFKKISNYGFIDSENFEMLLSFYAGDHHKKTMWRRFTNSYCRDSHFNTLVNGKN